MKKEKEGAFGGWNISDYQSFIFLFIFFLCNDIHNGIALGVFVFLGFNLYCLLYDRMVYQKRINHMVYIT